MDELYDVAKSIRNYFNLHIMNIEEIETITFSLTFHRISENELQIGWPVIQETRLEKSCQK